MAKNFPTKHDYWTPFEETFTVEHQGRNMSHDAAGLDPGERIFTNNRYQVNMTPIPTADDSLPPCFHLSIKRVDKAPIKSWRDFQKIKNLLVGPESTGIEFYPPESQLVDTANQYHLWVFVGVKMESFGVGWRERIVSEYAGYGSVQEPFSEHDKPADLKSAEEMQELLRQGKRQL